MPCLLILALLSGAPEHYGRFPDSWCSPEARVLDLYRRRKDPLWWDYARSTCPTRACVRFDAGRAKRELLEREGSFQEAWREVSGNPLPVSGGVSAATPLPE